MKNKFLGIPYIIWMAIFVVIPLFLILGYALTTRDGGFTLSNFASMTAYAGVFADSFLLAIVATVICLVIGYPIAYWLTRESPAVKRVAVIVLMLPMWINSFTGPTIIYAAMKFGWLNIPGKMIQVGQVPAPVSTVMITQDFRAIIFYVILFAVYYITWMPFFKAYEGQCIKEEVNI